MTSLAQRIGSFIDASPGWSAAILTIAAATSAVLAPSPSLAPASAAAKPMIVAAHGAFGTLSRVTGVAVR